MSGLVVGRAVGASGAGIAGAGARGAAARGRPTDRAWVEIDLDNIRHNAAVLSRLLPAGTRLMAVVKADAYGHGAVPVARCLEPMGVRDFAVATVDEGIQLRRAGIQGDILVLGYGAPERVREMVHHRLIQTIIDWGHGRRLAAAAGAAGLRVRVHIKVDTGMHRLGLDWRQQNEMIRLMSTAGLQVEGLFTHLAAADSLAPQDVSFTEGQIHRFRQVVAGLQARHGTVPPIHWQSTYGWLNYPQWPGRWVRVGLALYGVLSRPRERTRRSVSLRPALQWKARVALVRPVAAGERVGYGGGFVAGEGTRLAVIPVGYADGFARSLSAGRGHVLIHGCRAPVMASVCMDQLLVDVGGVPQVEPGDIVTLIGQDGGEVMGAEEVAAQAGTITNELLSRLGGRVAKIYHGGCS